MFVEYIMRGNVLY